MTEWGRTSSPGRPPSRRAWFFFGMLFGAAAAVGGAFVMFPGIDISQIKDIGGAQTRIVELEAELARVRQDSGTQKIESDAALSGQYDALAKLAEEQAGQLRELTGRLDIAEQLNGDLQAALDKAPSGDIESLRGQLAERDDLLTKYDAELTAIEKRAGELEAERDRLKSDAQAANAPKIKSPDASPGAQAAREKLDAAISEVASLKSALGERDNALGELDTEIARLSKFEGEAAELRKALNANAGKVAAGDAGEKANRIRLEGELANANRELLSSRAKLDQAQKTNASNIALLGERDKALGELDVEIARLSKFEAEAAELRKALAGNSGKTASLTREELERANRIRLEGELANANRELLASRAKLDQAQKTNASNIALLGERDKALGELDTEIARLSKFEAEAAELRKALAGNPGKPAALSPEEKLEIANRIRLEGELATAQREMQALQAKVAASEKTIASNEKALAQSGKAAADADAALSKELAAARTEIASLKSDIARISAEADAARTAKAAAPQKAAEPQKAAPLKERDPVLVAGAMAQAKGLENLDADARDRIGTGLIEGECVAKVLGDVFGKPPALAMRDLIRALDSDC